MIGRTNFSVCYTLHLFSHYVLQVNLFKCNICYAHLGGSNKLICGWFPCSIDKNKENFDCYTFMVCLLFDL
jgi:hypothetical protein